MLVDFFWQIYCTDVGCVKLIKVGGSSNFLVAHVSKPKSKLTNVSRLQN